MFDHIIRTDLSYAFYEKQFESLLKKNIKPFRRIVSVESDHEKSRNEPLQGSHNSRIGRVILYIEEHLTEELSLGKIAEEAHLSKYQLIRRFRETEGITPWKFLIRKRVDKAKELLENGVPPARVAVEAGFYDQSHLNRTFLDETGMTPGEYMEKYFNNRN